MSIYFLGCGRVKGWVWVAICFHLETENTQDSSALLFSGSSVLFISHFPPSLHAKLQSSKLYQQEYEKSVTHSVSGSPVRQKRNVEEDGRTDDLSQLLWVPE